MSPATVAAEPALLELAERALEAVRKELPSGAQAEVYASRGRERAIEMRQGRLESIQESRDQGMSLRVLQDGRMGFAYAAGLDLESLRLILPQVLAQIPFIPPDPNRAFPSPEPGGAPGLAATINDPDLFKSLLEDQIPHLREMESAALGSDKKIRQVLRLGYGESESEASIVNTLGVRVTERGTNYSAGLAALAESSGQIQVGGGSVSGCFYADLDFNRAGKEAAYRAASLLDSKKLPTGRRAVIFDPWMAGEFLGLIAEALSADAVQRGKSLFRGKIGSAIASPLVSVIDDPHRPRASGSSVFDDEGAPTRRKIMVERGVLREYFYDTYTGRKDKRSSNGSAGRASYKGSPGPSCTNFFIEPGKTGRQKLLEDTKDGVLVLEVMGMHTADSVSGEFSVGLSGIAVQNGKLTHGVRGAMLSGNILELLNHIDLIADDLTFYGRIATPTFRIADMMVA